MLYACLLLMSVILNHTELDEYLLYHRIYIGESNDGSQYPRTKDHS